MPDLMYINNLARFMNMFEILLMNATVRSPFPDIPDNGPGPKKLIRYDAATDTGYFGITTGAQLLTPAEVAALGPITKGTVVTGADTDTWLKFYYKGKVLFVGRTQFRTGMNYNDVYNAGMVFGTDDNGIEQWGDSTTPNTPTNQLKKAFKGDDEFIVRTLKASTVASNTAWTTTNPNITNSEVSLLLERVKYGPWGSLDTGAVGYNISPTCWTGQPQYWVSYGSNTTPNFRQQAWKATLGQAVWRPVLEHVPATPWPIIENSGPGPKTLLNYDKSNDTGYFGLVEQTDLFNFSDIDAVAKTPLTGTAVNRTVSNKWIKAYYKGKVLFMPVYCTREKILWTDIYKAGMQYGTDDNGKFQPGGVGVNQYTPITKVTPDGNTNLFKVRAIQGYGGNVLPASTASFDNAIMADSEYWAIRYRLVGVATNPGNLVPAPRTPWATLGSTQQYPFGVELTANNTQAVMFNDNNDWLRKTMQTIATSTFCSFYPVLELVSVTKP